MTGNNPTIEVLSGPERRRRWTTAEKLAMVEETYASDVTVRAGSGNLHRGYEWSLRLNAA